MPLTRATVAVVTWGKHDALALAIGNELKRAGYTPQYFPAAEPPPLDASIVFSFAPYGRWNQIPYALSQRERSARPLLIHWNTENPPDLRIPWGIMGSVGAARAWLDRLHEADAPRRNWLQAPPLRWLDSRMAKFRYVGEVHYAARKGWLNHYVESSEIYAALHAQHGLPTQMVRWGTVPEWCADLQLERDIDVLWFGIRRTTRRSRLLDQVRAELKARGIDMYVADGTERPLLHGTPRTEILNRAKVTLNLLPTWYDHAFPYRFHVAAGNRSLVITEPTLKHSSIYQAGEHYVSASIETLAETISYYIKNQREREAITENAYQLVMTRMTMGDSVRAILKAVEGERGRS